MSVSQDAWPVDEVLDQKYLITALIGEGGICRVYEARHRVLQHTVAIKVLKADRAKNATTRERFKQEGLATAALKHPNLVVVQDILEHRGLPCLVMERLHGVDLDQFLHQNGRLSVDATLAIMLPVLSAVQHAHSRGLIHRDLKPSNIMIEHTAEQALRPVVVDFGIARLSNDFGGRARTRDGVAVGTPAYMAPEQSMGSRHVTERSDQYALAVILYECLTGRFAFEGEDSEDILDLVRAGQYRPIRALAPEVPEALAAAVERAMALDPARRFEDLRAFASELVASVGAVVGASGIAQPPRSSLPSPMMSGAYQPAINIASSTIPSLARGAAASASTPGDVVSTFDTPGEGVLGGGRGRGTQIAVIVGILSFAFAIGLAANNLQRRSSSSISRPLAAPPPAAASAVQAPVLRPTPIALPHPVSQPLRTAQARAIVPPPPSVPSPAPPTSPVTAVRVADTTAQDAASAAPTRMPSRHRRRRPTSRPSIGTNGAPNL